MDINNPNQPQTGDSQEKLAYMRSIAQGLGNIAQALGTTTLPVGTVQSTAGASAGYVPITVGGVEYLVQIFATS